MALDDQIRAMAARGELTHLLLTRTERGDYQASCKRRDGAFVVDIRSDPVSALLVAIGAVSVLDMNLNDRSAKLGSMFE